MAWRSNSQKVRVHRLEIAERCEWICGICEGPVDNALRYPHPLCASVDHIVPLANGGSNEVSNLQLAHKRCNEAKRNVEGYKPKASAR